MKLNSCEPEKLVLRTATSHLVVALLALTAFLPAVSAQAEEAPALFDPPVAGLAAAPAPRALLANSRRTRSLSVNAPALATLRPGQTNRLSLPLFGDRAYTALLTQGGTQPGPFAVWRGTLEGQRNSMVSLVHRDGTLVMSIYDGNTNMFYVKPQRDGGHFVEEAGPGQQGTCGTAEPAPARPPGPAPAKNAAADARPKSAAETWVDVLILYTPNARVNAGGVNAIQAVAWEFVEHSNWVHGRSDTRTRLRLVGIEEIAYDDSEQNLSTHLQRLDDPDDGFMDSAIARRDATGADLVILLPHGRANSGTTLGVAYLNWWSGVVEWSQDALVFTHETAHNLGCTHEVASPDGNYNHGYSKTESWNLVLATWTETRVTVMNSLFSPSTRTDYFSNPGINFTFTGGSCGGLGDGGCADAVHPLGLANQADNARWLRENRSTTANRTQPVFYVATWGGDSLEVGRGTAIYPENDLPDIYNEWIPNTELMTASDAVIRIWQGNYSAPGRISRKGRLENWGNAGTARLGP